MKMATLKENPTLPELQQYIKEICKERGWDKNNYLEIFLLFTEEVGELAKAMRKQANLYNEQEKNNTFHLAEEFADVFSYLLDLANYFDINIEQAFRDKDKINANRKWD